jgi:hypothetical protein
MASTARKRILRSGGAGSEVGMENFRDLSALCGVLRLMLEESPREERQAAFADALQKALGFASEPAGLYAATVFHENTGESPDRVLANGSWLTRTWVRGEQQGNVGAWLSTTTERWRFDEDLTYRYTFERIDTGLSSGPFFQSSYTKPRTNEQRGIWAPPDTQQDQFELFVMPFGGVARPLPFEWVEKEVYGYAACMIGGTRFTRE